MQHPLMFPIYPIKEMKATSVRSGESFMLFTPDGLILLSSCNLFNRPNGANLPVLHFREHKAN